MNNNLSTKEHRLFLKELLGIESLYFQKRGDYYELGIPEGDGGVSFLAVDIRDVALECKEYMGWNK